VPALAGGPSTSLRPPQVTLRSTLGNQALGQLLEEQLTLSGGDSEDALEQARYDLAHSYVLTQADRNPEITAARLLGNARYGPYLAAYNRIDPLHWRPGLIIFVPPHVDPAEAQRVLQGSYRHEARAMDERERNSHVIILESEPNELVEKFIGPTPMLVEVPGKPGTFALSEPAAAFLDTVLLHGFATRLDVRGVEFEFIATSRPGMDAPDDLGAATTAVPGPVRKWKIEIDATDWAHMDSARKLSLLAHHLVHVAQDMSGKPMSSKELAMSSDEQRYRMTRTLMKLRFEGVDPVDPCFTREQLAMLAMCRVLWLAGAQDEERWCHPSHATPDARCLGN
jgi:hypothetical protein